MEHCSLLPLWRPDRESSTDFGQHRTSASRSEVPRRDDGSGQTSKLGSGNATTRARLVGLSSTDTIRWRPRADPVQKQGNADAERQPPSPHTAGETDNESARRRPDTRQYVAASTGTGKTHLAIAIARSCIHAGARGRFYNVVDLVNRLEAESGNGRQGRIADYL